MLLACLCLFAAAPDVLPSTARVSVSRGEGGAFGSAVCVGWKDGWAYLLTCRHVVEGGTGYEAELAGHPAMPAVLVRTSPDCDLALLKIPAKVCPTLARIALVEPAVGETCYQCGYGHCLLRQRSGQPLGKLSEGNWHVGFGVVSGDSGSGVFDESGRLCGIVWGSKDGETRCVPAAKIWAFVRAADCGPLPRLGGKGK